MKKLIKDLEDNGYIVFRDKEGEFGVSDSFYLHDKKLEGRRTQVPYVATIFLKKNKYLFNNLEYTSVEELRLAINQHIKTLPYLSENYDPMLYKQCFVEFGIHDYLKSLGFDYTSGENYIYKDKDNKMLLDLKITFNEDKHKTNGEVFYYINTFTYIHNTFVDLESALSAINSVILPKILSDLALYIKLTESLNDSRNFDNITEIKIDKNNLQVFINPIKEKTIKMLEETLNELKK